jgi:hypothetical protein
MIAGQNNAKLTLLRRIAFFARFFTLKTAEKSQNFIGCIPIKTPAITIGTPSGADSHPGTVN